jgi:UDP-N-acetylglucosamine 4-epimerase
MIIPNQLASTLTREPRTWLVTGVAGFIGSHLLEALLRLGQRVRGLDNFSTGQPQNLVEVRKALAPGQWRKFKLIRASVSDLAACEQACAGVDFILHQAALGSVPRSIEEPLQSHESNVTGFVTLLVAAGRHRVKRVVYASSSSVYGDEPRLPKVEARVGRPLSPYAATKRIDEIYADAFASAYGLETIGLRYFNVFGPRQDPAGPYAAVIPKWIEAMIRGEPACINGDGATSRDFCYVANVVQANLLAATTRNQAALGQVFNVAIGGRTTLNELFDLIRHRLARRYPRLKSARPVYRDFRPGDVRHSHADIRKARQLLGYRPTHTVAQGLDAALDWYVRNLS